MSKQETATEAENTTVVKEEVVAPEVSQLETDALDAAAGGVTGALTPNSPVEENDENSNDDSGTEDNQGDNGEESSDDSSTESQDSQEENKSAPELATEKDEAGVYKEPTTEDPGEFTPGDYSFEIKTTDGKVVKISSQEEIDEFAAKLDENSELINASQYTMFNRKSVAMDQGIATDKRNYEANKAKFDQEQSLQTTRQESLTQWNNEINYLANNGELPKISDKLNSADWTDPEVAKEPAVKARLDIFKWMESENSKRMTAGLEPIKSVVDAHNAMQLESFKTQQKDTVSREKEQRQKKGSMVGGAAPHSPSNNPSNSIVGTGGSLDDMVTDYMNQQ